MSKCVHCRPHEVSSLHLLEKLETVLWPIEKVLETVKPPHAPSGFFLKLLLASGLLAEEDARGYDGLSSRTKVVIEAAGKRGLEIKSVNLLGRSVNLFSALIKGRKIFFEGLPHVQIGRRVARDVDNKEQFAKLLTDNGLPHASSRTFMLTSRAAGYAQSIGFPVVVKPRRGSLSKHVSYPVRNPSELREAIRIARLLHPEFIVERYIVGPVHRVTVVGYEKVAVCIREPAEAFGKVTLAAGAKIHDVSNLVNHQTKDMFMRLAHICDLSVIGFDFICPDISQSWREQECGVIEANSLPYINMHHYPDSGESQDVGGWIIEELLAGRL